MFKNLKIWQNLTILCALFLLVIAFLMFMLFNFITQHGIKHTQKQLYGIEYQTQVIELLRHVQEYRGLTYGYLNGVKQFKPLLQKEYNEIMEDISTIDSIDKKYGKLLNTTDKWNEIKNNLEVSHKDLQEYTTPDQFFDLYNYNAEEIINFILLIFLRSNIELNMNLGTHILIDASSKDLPWLSEGIGRARAVGSSALIGDSISSAQREDLLYVMELMEYRLHHLLLNIEIIYKNNPGIKDLLSPYVEDVEHGTNEIIELIREEVLSQKKHKLSPSVLFQKATITIGKSFALYQQIIPIQTLSITKRMEGYKKEFRKTMIISVSATIILLFVAFMIVRDIVAQINYAVRVAKEIRDGKRSLNIESFADNETGILLQTMQDMLDSINKNEKALDYSREKLAEAQRIANLGNWIWNILDDEFWLSDEAISIFALSDRDERLSFTSYMNLVHPEDREYVKRSFDDVLNKKDSVEIDHRLLLNDERILIVHQRIQNTADDETALTGTIQDITVRKKMEEEINKTQNLESLGMLAGVIAHEFNNVLTMIFGYVSMAILEAKDNDLMSDRLNKISNAANMAKQLANRLLTFAKGGGPILRDVDMWYLLKNNVNNFNDEMGVTIEDRISDGLWKVKADENQLSAVIENIFNNAFEADPDGQNILIEAENVDIDNFSSVPLEQGKYVRFSITDGGVGIDPAIGSKIFDPYFSTKTAGHGIGLTIALSIVKNHSGHISTESTLGEGSVFTVYIPAVVNENVE